jgi:transcriptional regulator with XRE-family HTH domain
VPSRKRENLHPLPRRLADARKRLGVSQAKLGELAGLDPSVASARINQYEQGVHEPKYRTASRLAMVLGVPTAYLYCEEDDLAELLANAVRVKRQKRN